MDPDSAEYVEWRDNLIETSKHLNFDAVIELTFYMAFEAKLTDKYIWRAIEAAILENFHLYELKHTCQLQWAVSQIKPKHTSSRLDNMLQKVALDYIEKGIETPEDFHHIMQGHRNKKSNDIYLKLKASLIDRKDLLMG